MAVPLTDKHLEFFSAQTESLEEWIRDGRSDEVRRALAKISEKKIPRAFAASLARLAWRAAEPELGLRLLFRLVKSSSRRQVTPTVDEIAEYAVCLAKCGAINEADELLGKLDKTRYPRVSLYRAIVSIERWDYAEAIPFLEEFLREPTITHYERLVGMANLAASFVYLRHDLKATSLLRKLLHEASLRRNRLLLVYVLDLGAKHFFQNGDLAKAEKLLKQAEGGLRDKEGIRAFFVDKWTAFLRLRRESGSSSARNAVLSIRERATARKHWESVRDCDRALAIAEENGPMITYLHFGTPFPGFRKRLVEDLGPRPPAIPDEFLWAPGFSAVPWESQGREFGAIVSLETGRVEGRAGKSSAARLKLGSLHHRLLVILCMDFYRPARPVELFSRLFPGEYFNPDTAPIRVHQAVRRLRKWLKDAAIPADIAESGGSYRLEGRKNFAVKIHYGQHPQSRTEAGLSTIAIRFAGQTLTRAEIAQALGYSDRSARRLLLDAVKSGHARRVGTGGATRYAF